jgi:hypothetical protein
MLGWVRLCQVVKLNHGRSGYDRLGQDISGYVRLIWVISC